MSNFLYLSITKNVVNSGDERALIVVSIAAGVGCCIAVQISNRLSKEKTYVNVIMSDDIKEMKLLRDFLVENKITNVVSDSYTRDWSRKTLTITAYAETKNHSKMIDEYIAQRNVKFKRFVQDRRVRK